MGTMLSGGFLLYSVSRNLGHPEWLLEPWVGTFILFHSNQTDLILYVSKDL